LAFGHTFALQSEHDQAMSAYRTATRILPEAHLPLLYIAMELISVNNFNLAEQYLFQSKDKCSRDPLIYNELGVISYKNKEYSKSLQYFNQSLELITSNKTTTSSTTTGIVNNNSNNEIKEVALVNIAHSFRKLKRYSEAIKYYTLCLALSTNNSSIYVALGFTYQLQGNFTEAIDYYHKCLALKPEDSFATDCLTQCLELISYS
jgi:anaphase-promoting complex subunit 6